MVERNSMRSIRDQPFCWQEKKINRLIRKIYRKDKVKMSKMLLLYQTLTEIDSDFNGQNINFYTKTIVTYSGLNKDIVPKYLKELEDLNILKIIEKKENWKFAWKDLIFTPKEIIDPEEKKKAYNNAISTVTWKVGNGNSENGLSDIDNSITDNFDTLEDNNYLENINNKNNNDNEKKEIKLLLNNKGIKDKNYIENIINKYWIVRINEVIKECDKKQRTSPSWFIREALEKNWEFPKNSTISDKYILKKKQEEIELDKIIALQLKNEHNKKLIDDWIINNKEDYESLIIQETEAFNKKYSKLKVKDPSIMIKSNVRAFIKTAFLGL